jgi:hypothetical protein
MAVKFGLWDKKVKVKFPLHVNNYHTMETHPSPNYESRHEDVLGSVCIAGRILNPGTAWKWDVTKVDYESRD